MGMGIPVFVHYARVFIRKHWHDWKMDFGEWILFAKLNFNNDWREARAWLKSLNRN